MPMRNKTSVLYSLVWTLKLPFPEDFWVLPSHWGEHKHHADLSDIYGTCSAMSGYEQ